MTQADRLAQIVGVVGSVFGMVPDPSATATTRAHEALASLGFRPAATDSPTHLGLGRGPAPSFLMPVRTKRVAAASCWAFNALRPRTRRMERAAVGALVRATGSVGPLGTPYVLADDAAIHELVAEIAAVLGRSHLDVALGVGNLDQWWKPTLQLFDDAGRPAAYAKIGWTPLTAGLVDTEGAALAGLERDRPSGFSVPRLVARLSWRDAPVVVTAPMPLDVRRADGVRASDVLGAALEWSSRSAPDATSAPALESTPWWSTLDEAASGDEQFQAVLEAARTRIGQVRARTAPWHGDLVPWNLAVTGSTGRVWVWDWEYSSPEVPLGLDAVHWTYQVRSVTHGEPVGVAAALAIENFDRTLSDRWLTADEDLVMAVAHPLELLARLARANRLGGQQVETSRALMARLWDVLR